MSIQCNHCRKFISYKDFDDKSACYGMLTPDSEYSEECFMALCKKCNTTENENYKINQFGVKMVD